jgi:flagellar hook-associated protein 1 FlgK
MKASFFEFRVATSGLQVARTGLNVTSHNVANADNKGFSRQFIEQRADRPLTFYNGRGMFGTGADVFGVGQHRSFFLDKKFWHENSIRGEHSVKTSQLRVPSNPLYKSDELQPGQGAWLLYAAKNPKDWICCEIFP